MSASSPETPAAIRIAVHTDSAILPHIRTVADLRIRLFRHYPYLYDGSPDYEERYLRGFAQTNRALLLLAFDGDRPVATATSLPLASGADILEGADKLFEAEGYNPHSVYYYSEILVEPAYRGLGIARRFYEHRAQFARHHGYQTASFAAIVKPESHPQRPPGYFDPAVLWHRLGFTPHPDLRIQYEWPTIEADGSTIERAHTLRFWTKSLL